MAEKEDEEDLSSIFLALKTSASSTRPPRHTSSKYDFVKVRVWLGDNSDHYYVLSRFLVSRMLTVTKIPNHVAIKISLELKKLLIDNSLLDVSQSDLEANLFKLMERRGYGSEYINRYKMMTGFHHQRVPLVILVCGTACVGKSTIATQLAQRLNLPNVLQTDMVYELLRTSTDAPLASTPIWAREFGSPEELVTEFCRECRIVRKGLDGDLKKAMKDGKPVIIEGAHLDPSIYLMDDENRVTNPQSKDPVGSDKDRVTMPDLCQVGAVGSSKDKEGIDTGSSTGPVKDLNEKQKSTDGTSNSVIQSDGEKVTGAGPCGVGNIPPSSTVPGQDGLKKSTRHPAKCIVVPIVLRMADVDHQTLLEEWIACRSVDGTDIIEGKGLIRRLQTIQDYLCSFESQGMKVVNISATTFPQTLDWLHSYLLQCIERGCSAPGSTTVS